MQSTELLDLNHHFCFSCACVPILVITHRDCAIASYIKILGLKKCKKHVHRIKEAGSCEE